LATARPGNLEPRPVACEPAGDPIAQHIQSLSTLTGSRRGLAELGAPLDGIDFRFVNGLGYLRVRPLISPDRPPRRRPPTPVLKLAMKVHPAIQDVDLAALDDAALVRHVHRTIDHAVVMWDHHFHLHSHDLGPVGLLLDAAVGWGLAASEVIPLLEGASPSTSEAERVLRRIRDQVDRVGGKPNTLDELRQVGPDIAADLDAFLRLRGHLIVSRYDIDGLTLAEARASMDLRDDNGPHTLEWPLGLIRLALLELGRRMVNRGWTRWPPPWWVRVPPATNCRLVTGGGVTWTSTMPPAPRARRADPATGRSAPGHGAYRTVRAAGHRRDRCRR